MDTVILRNAKAEGSEASKDTQVIVHRALLQHFSRKYSKDLAERLADVDADATGDAQNVVITKLSARVLKMVVAWIYTGEVASSGVPGPTHMDLIELYIFASDYDMIALRRYALAKLQVLMATSSTNTAFSPTIRPNLPGMMEVRRAFDGLHKSSPLRSWLVEAYVHHYSPGRSRYKAKDWSGLPAEFLAAVMHGKAKLLDQAEEHNNSFSLNPLLGYRKEPCRCCHTKCHYHEHENSFEQIAACNTGSKASAFGASSSANIRERIFQAKFGGDAHDGHDEIA